MRVIALVESKPDMVLGKSIYSIDGKLLLAAGMFLLPKYVERLRTMGIITVYISDPEIGKIEINDVITERTRLEAKLAVYETAQNFRTTGNFTDREVKKAVNNIMDELLSNHNVLVQLTDIKSVDETEYVFSHSVNVCVLALMTGIALGYNQLVLQDLGTGALLHDLGKIQVPQLILNKPGSLNSDEYEQVKEHSHLGWEILRGQNCISKTAASVAYQHHEFYNGRGYPQGLKGSEIHEYSRIVGLVDVYDALTSDRVYRKRFLPHEAAEYLQSFAGHQFDPEITRTFLGNIAIYPLGTLLRLNTGQKVAVVGCPKAFPTRPKVRILNPGGEDHFSELELDCLPSIAITEVLD